ncbi:flagellar hook-length control protein FliK [Roseburia intestinalis]|jgi:Flagellar hook-length control protein FliK./TOBE domain.|uniref:Flagellar hook-length control protein FliK n=1 Tax=Roseburia intestinalis TaxID=166486 RepID=A0A3R6KBK5_9FIRM|nr:flagellar hook-length control protein FliK [Roseburia intestinalis]RHA70134.1 flagellar hook-length control protein FliK [Roseburia intestinalis]RHN10340.1 flagellar hook-length control protein FliK [Roseburia intestinalis]
MQIRDMLGQYSQNVKNGTEELMSAQGTQKLVSSMQELEPGSTFEGTVNSVKNGKVVLALGNGQTITARLDGKVSIQPGESMFFQVRSNDGTTIALRPYVQAGNINNPILLNALTAAGVPATERNITMVDSMMKEQMSISRQSILDMGRVVGSNPNVNVNTAVLMTKIGLPVSAEMASQFENYMVDQHAIVDEMDLAMNQLGRLLGDADLGEEQSFELYGKVLDILNGEGETPAQTTDGLQQNDTGTMVNAGENIEMEAAVQQSKDGAAAEGVQKQVQQQNTKDLISMGAAGQEQSAGVAENTENIVGEQTAGNAAQSMQTGIDAADVLKNTQADTAADFKNVQEQTDTLEQILDQNGLDHLKRLLQNIPTLTGNTDLFEVQEEEDVFVDTMSGDDAGKKAFELAQAEPEVTLKQSMTAEDFLNTLRDALKQNQEYGFAGMTKLFGSKEFAAILKNRAEKQWLLEPEQLKEASKVSDLYERLDHQMKQMENVMKAAGVTQNSFVQTAADIRSNVEFMNQINQVYTYVQLPLKLSGQNASGDLYVYTNKKNLNDPEAELTAFLHLDLDNLGSTDVSIRMKDKNVKTNFYIADDASYDLIEKHLPVLEKRLAQKGYRCSITMSKEEKKVEFVEDFLQRDMPQAGTLHRYSFDVRA